MTSYDTKALLVWRRERDKHFRSHYASPIPEEHLETFTRLSYFPPDPALVIEGAFESRDGKIEIISSTGGTAGYRVAGRVTLTVHGDTRSVIALRGEDDDVFIPFRDGTCGAESYGGGRYVPALLNNESVIIDFNKASNPWCAYDEEFSCPLPPAENWFEARIAAGEMVYRPPGR